LFGIPIVQKGVAVTFKFEDLEVWQLSIEYVDLIYDLADELPSEEKYNLRTQITRAATSVSLNIAEGSTGQTDAEQSRFIGHSVRSLLETVACLHLIHRREHLSDSALLREAYNRAELLVKKLQAFRRAIAPNKPWVREEELTYEAGTPFEDH
jgi:four helix bundle protein